MLTYKDGAMKKKMTIVMWSSFLPMLNKALATLPFIEATVFSNRELDNGPSRVSDVLASLETADCILLYRSTETFWGEIETQLTEAGKRIPVVCVAADPSNWALSTVAPAIIAKTYSYMVRNGEDNFVNMFCYLAATLLEQPIAFEEPKEVAWQGIYHGKSKEIFTDINKYLSWYGPKFPQGPTVGVLFTRNAWVNGFLAVEDALIGELETLGCNVICAFSYSVKRDEPNCKGSGEVVTEWFFDENGKSRIDCFIKLQSFFLSSSSGTDSRSKTVAQQGADLLKKLNVPVIGPVHNSYKTVEEWEAFPQGLASSSVGWSIALPEFEGVIEPIIASAERRLGNAEAGSDRQAITARCSKIAKRAAQWARLGNTPVAERKVAFILHNNPCASVEASVGGGAKLDTLESVSDILSAMQKNGYTVTKPANGKDLIDTIMNRKAISEFRWTTTAEMVKKGGVLAHVTKEKYCEWFDTLPEKVKTGLIKSWGNPPGEEVDEIPPAMLYEGNILVTGVLYGNAVICVQPKRGCAGARCDGKVCKILHDPLVPPTHQYLATYKYLERDFGAHVIIHVGTHGNLEFLPGKGVALSESCFPDIAIGNMPHLYIYNSDNPAEGVIAKRRGLATLVDHMQTVLTSSGLYDELEALDRLLEEFERSRNSDPSRRHAIRHQIVDSIFKAKLENEIRVNEKETAVPAALSTLSHDQLHELDFDQVVRGAHDILSRIRNTQITDGMHIFGRIPTGDALVSFINSMMRYDAGMTVSLRRTIAACMGLSLKELLTNPATINALLGKPNGVLIEQIDALSKQFIAAIIDPDSSNSGYEVLLKITPVEPNKDEAHALELRVHDLVNRINQSLEIAALHNGMDAGFIEPGPSGLIMRGRDDILPTGRNFFALDPLRIPTKAAWEVGKRLADAMIAKHIKDEGRYPENMAIYWMCNDIMWADGEGMSQIMYLLGVQPAWQSNGRVEGFAIIPLQQLGRPRIDVTVRVSGITRDNFPASVELLDEAIQAVAMQDEPEDMNFVRKHSMRQITESGASESDSAAWRDATLRVFAAQPGSYSAGTQLAVYASSWKEEKELGEVFVYWNGYAYGKGMWGEKKHKQLAESLKTVDITYNKVVSDEGDLLNCCCYFGTHGGMTAAARSLSGKEVRTYYGDTREPGHVEMRSMADEIKRVVRTKLLNPKWIDGMKRHGYKGAGDIMKRVGRVYGWEATTQEVDDWVFDDITKTFVLDEKNRKFFEENNPWALEEIGRRLLEAEQRGLWKADPEVLEQLKDRYLEIESWMEEANDAAGGEFQGSAVDILTMDDVSAWKGRMAEVHKLMHYEKK
jgi:cobaltochelatase CobN